MGYRTYVLFKAYNDLVPELPELGWLSKHSDASRALYDLFSEMQQLLDHLAYDEDLVFHFNSPVIHEAIVDIQLAMLEDKIITAEDAMEYIPRLLQTHSALKGITLKVRKYKACVYTLDRPLLRRPVKAHKVAKAA